MLINDEIYDIVGIVAIGLLSEAVAKLGMEFTPESFAEIVLSKRGKDDPQEIQDAIDELLQTKMLLLQDGKYFSNSNYVRSDEF